MTISRKEYNKQYYKQNREREQQRAKEYYHANKDKIDREKQRQYCKEWYEKNKYKRNPLTDEQKKEKNRKRRERYANDEEYREQTKAKVRNYNKKYPRKKRDTRLKNDYGITANQFEQILEKQNGGCAICGAKRTNIQYEGKKEQSLHVDHNHKTNEVRGILCHNCNFGLGHFQDNIELLLKAVEYLKDA